MQLFPSNDPPQIGGALMSAWLAISPEERESRSMMSRIRLRKQTNWRVLFHWFLSATAMYMCMIVPTTTVVVSDTINPTVGNGAVANVPIGLAMVASFSSQVNNWLTKTAESVFTMPSALTYSAGG
jgi:hypothetical protein